MDTYGNQARTERRTRTRKTEGCTEGERCGLNLFPRLKGTTFVREKSSNAEIRLIVEENGEVGFLFWSKGGERTAGVDVNKITNRFGPFGIVGIRSFGRFPYKTRYTSGGQGVRRR